MSMNTNLELSRISPEELTEIAEIERPLRASALLDNAKLEAEWGERGYSWAWLDEPRYDHPYDWGWLASVNVPGFCDAFAQPAVVTRRTVRLTLPGGGQIRSMENFELNPATRDHPLLGPTFRSSWWLRIVTPRDDRPDRLLDVDGCIYEGTPCEMYSYAVVIYERDHQPLAERVAAIFRLIDCNFDNLLALLDSAKGCAFCGRALVDPVSKALSIGPDCARKHHITHSMAAAEQRLALRRKLLGVS